MERKFEKEAANEKNPKWESMIKRQAPLYSRQTEVRTEFERDYTRIIHSTAYRRLKHKTQVFFSPQNDHICTRSEHVIYVESISEVIAKHLGLNVELTRAISIGHDLGHSPFGHKGELVLSDISKRELSQPFFHEQNGLYLVDNIELLEDYQKCEQNLNLTYAVRDGIISHCGEIDETALNPRQEAIDLTEYKTPNQYSPYTWEACIVKISDKISYILRDIEDAITLKILNPEKLEELEKILKSHKKDVVNNTVIINSLTNDLCENSNIETGLCFSNTGYELINAIKEFNYKNIYFNDRLKASNRYFEVILNQIYDTLKSTYNGKDTLQELETLSKLYPNIGEEFTQWIQKYWDIPVQNEKLKNKKVYNMESEQDYKKAILTYISGMTDNYAIKTYNEIISF